MAGEKDKQRRQAAALSYSGHKEAAPQVVASGAGEIAERIIALAEEAGIAIQKDPDLMEVLAKVPVGSEIPVEIYQAVAEVLAFVYEQNGRFGQQDA